jgi:tetratricopeptide (TPR) repeat protein
MSKENSNKNKDEKENISNKKEDINEDKMYEEELKKLLYDENKTTISTNEVAESLITNEKIKNIRNMKFDSDDLFKNNKYEEAINKYKDTVNILLEEFSEKNDMNNLILENLKGEIIMPCYQNIALCYMKLKNWLKMKTYSKKVLEIDPDNIKANCRLCLSNIKLGHLKKADHLLEELEKKIGGSPELEDLERIYARNKLNAEGNNDELLKKMGKKLTDGKINMYEDKKMNIEIEKVENNNKWNKYECVKNIKKCFKYFWSCCKKKKIKGA